MKSVYDIAAAVRAIVARAPSDATLVDDLRRELGENLTPESVQLARAAARRRARKTRRELRSRIRELQKLLTWSESRRQRLETPLVDRQDKFALERVNRLLGQRREALLRACQSLARRWREARAEAAVHRAERVRLGMEVDALVSEKKVLRAEVERLRVVLREIEATGATVADSDLDVMMLRHHVRTMRFSARAALAPAETKDGKEAARG